MVLIFGRTAFLLVFLFLLVKKYCQPWLERVTCGLPAKQVSPKNVTFDAFFTLDHVLGLGTHV